MIYIHMASNQRGLKQFFVCFLFFCPCVRSSSTIVDDKNKVFVKSKNVDRKTLKNTRKKGLGVDPILYIALKFIEYQRLVEFWAV